MYCIGIGGIGMSALARYFHARGVSVSGYDKTKSPLTLELEASGIPVHYEANTNLLPKQVDLVMFTPAIPNDHKELVHFRQKEIPVLKRSEVLQLVTKDAFTIAVAGTHGKTTVSTMIAHLLKSSGYDCTAFLGGISVNYQSNLILGDNNVMVVEADEFDRSFLKLSPDIAVITAIDEDHLDVYGTKAILLDSFSQFSNQLAPNGKLVIKHGLVLENSLPEKNILTYSLSNNLAQAYGSDVLVKNGAFEFQYQLFGKTSTSFRLNYPGWHNVENAVAAISVATMLNIPNEKIYQALVDFKGIKRRFEIITDTPKLVIIDDYAHHPEEINALLKSVRMMYPTKNITLVFQPHLYSRTRDFASGFAASLTQADSIILLDIYPAREKPIPGITSDMILDKIRNKQKIIVSKSELIDTLIKSRPEVLLMVGAGDIDTLVLPVKNALLSNEH